jgi:hypothetical protein
MEQQSGPVVWIGRHTTSIVVGVVIIILGALVVAFIPAQKPPKPKIEYWVKRVALLDDNGNAGVYKIEFFNTGRAEEQHFKAKVEFGSPEGSIEKVNAWPDGLTLTKSSPVSLSLATDRFNDGDHFTVLILFTSKWWESDPKVKISGDGPRALEIDPDADQRRRSAYMHGAGFAFAWMAGVVLLAYLVARISNWIASFRRQPIGR